MAPVTFAAVACVSAAVQGQERVAVGLRYSGSPSCPSEADFVDEVNARVPRPIAWNVGGEGIDMRVSVSADGAQATGTLEVVQPGVEPKRREFRASSCAEVGSALALVAALTLDPNARTDVLPARAPVPAADGPAPALVPPADVAPPAPPKPPPAPPPVPAARAVTPPRSSPRASPAALYSAWIGPAAGVASGYASEPLVTLGVTLGVRTARRGWSPGVQLTPLWGKTGTTGPTAALGTFTWAMARLEGCPAVVALAANLSLEPCLAAELGRLSARGADGAVAVPTTRKLLWASFGATLSLQWSGKGWFSRAGALLLYPATRYELVFSAPDRLVYQPGVALGGTIALGFRFGE